MRIKPTVWKARIQLRCEKLGLDLTGYDTLHRTRMSDTLDKNEVQLLANNSSTYTEIAKTLGCSSGYAKQILAELDIDFIPSRKKNTNHRTVAIKNNSIKTQNDNRQGFIYKITNNINSKIYIGQTSNNPIIRWREHISISRNSNRSQYNYPLYRAFRKYGLENFSFEVLDVCSISELDNLECYYIEKYSSNQSKIGYNQTAGGMTNRKFTPSEEQDIANYYAIHRNLSQTAYYFDISIPCAKNIIKRNGADENAIKNNRWKSLCRPVYQYDLNDNLLQVFESLSDVGRWMIDNGLSTSKNLSSAAYVIRDNIINGNYCLFGYKWDMEITDKDRERVKKLKQRKHSQINLPPDQLAVIIDIIEKTCCYGLAEHITGISIEDIKANPRIKSLQVRGIEWHNSSCKIVGTDICFRTASDAGHWLSEQETGMEYTDKTRRGRAVKKSIEHHRELYGYKFEYLTQEEFWNTIQNGEIISYTYQENRSIPPQKHK